MKTMSQKYLTEVEAHEKTQRLLNQRSAVLHTLLEALTEHPDFAHVKEHCQLENYALASHAVQSKIKELNDQESLIVIPGTLEELTAGIFATEGNNESDSTGDDDLFHIPDSDDDFNPITY